MPFVNVYFAKQVDEKFTNLIPDLKEFIAEQLTCGDIKLTSEEVSIRYFGLQGGEMIANVELEISAHSFIERIAKQDEICNRVRKFVQEKTDIDCRVWLQLSELGHSW